MAKRITHVFVEILASNLNTNDCFGWKSTIAGIYQWNLNILKWKRNIKYRFKCLRNSIPSSHINFVRRHIVAIRAPVFAIRFSAKSMGGSWFYLGAVAFSLWLYKLNELYYFCLIRVIETYNILVLTYIWLPYNKTYSMSFGESIFLEEFSKLDRWY